MCLQLALIASQFFNCKITCTYPGYNSFMTKFEEFKKNNVFMYKNE